MQLKNWNTSLLSRHMRNDANREGYIYFILFFGHMPLPYFEPVIYSYQGCRHFTYLQLYLSVDVKRTSTKPPTSTRLGMVEEASGCRLKRLHNALFIF